MNDRTSVTPARLKHLREQAGMSQSELAAALYAITGTATVTRHEVSRWENGKRRPTAWLDALALALNVDLAELLGPGTGFARDDAAAEEPGSDLAMLGSFRSADLQMGGGHLYSTVMGYLRTSVGPRIFGDTSQSDSSKVFAAAAGFTEMAGWMAHDAGHDPLALQHFRRAREFAQMSPDHELGAHIHASLSHLHIQQDTPAEAINQARQGLTLIESSAPAPHLSARLSAMEARGHAARGRSEACGKALARAERMIAHSTTSPASPWASDFDAASLASEAAHCELRLGHLNAAEKHARRIVELRSGPRVRSRAFGQLLLASVLLRQHRLDEACAVALDVIATTTALSPTS
ncbi:helix-turn-helix domain-containing protein [Actinocorallia sp. A-T 12471]|uniref:helix-turn-helix domain-containing protein n=1 Tax=Actinocorallia sp. A-T 12471 TaxID=3089813 RepID=UPI0029CCC063|nr:helix-turn-helix domain-containing protein [Actinocorallia sp. A-T 12471]MDX6738692.1 helix-turn-helix domain-containing protein [Actinocorallia sp. A-T 12471]